MATKPKAILSTHDGREASPITRALNVLFENGQTAQDVLNDRQDAMISPVIENSSSMFKVGQGDNVDYSSNVVNGAYEGMVLKGKTMVNCIQESSSQDVVLPYEFEEGRYVTINDTKESGALGVELKGQTLVNLASEKTKTGANNLNIMVDYLKPNTQYTVIFNYISDNPINGRCSLGNVMGVNNISFVGENGLKKVLLTTPELTSSNYRLFIYTNNNDTYTVDEVMVIEGNHTDVDIPYFTSMQSVKMPVLTTINGSAKILTDTYLTKTGELSPHHNSNKAIEDYILIPPMDVIVSNVSWLFICFYDENKNFISDTGGTNINKFELNDTTIPANAKYFRFHYNAVTLPLIRFVNGTDYIKATIGGEPFKTNILTVNEPVELRGIGEVQDELNLLTGELVSNFDEVILTGDERVSNWATSGSFFVKSNRTNQLQNNNIVLCVSDKIPSANVNDIYRDTVGIGSIDGNFIVRLPQLTTSDEVSNWLKQNAPIKVLYATKQATIKTVDLNVVDQNGSVIPTLKSWNTTTHIYSEIPENSLYPILSHSNPTYPVILKPSTKYSIVANSYSNNHTNSAINFNLGGATASTTVGNRVTTITTPSTLSNELLTMSGRGNKLNNVMVIEGDVAGDVPYFEGICDCKSPILSNVGKNLFNGILLEQWSSTSGAISNNSKARIIKMKVKPNTTYVVTRSESGNRLDIIMFASEPMLGANTVVGTALNAGSNTTATSFTTTNDTSWIIIRAIDNIDNYTSSVDFQVEEGSAATSYEPYKTNILSCETYFDETTQSDKTIVLRSLPNGACDTLNVETGEYTRKIGEIIIDGSENWELSANFSSTYNAYYFVSNETFKNNLKFICDKYKISSYSEIGNTIGLAMGTSGDKIAPFITSDKMTLSEFKEYLSKNPTTIQYELATPIVSTVDIQGFPHAYTNGHVLLSSGHSGQSLTPKVEYSVVTNRNGQIRSNQKMVERHQKQLDQLQAIILANLVNSQYNQTLTTLKYELSRV